MKTCPHCHIQIGGSAKYCPLCQNRLSGPDEAPWWPKITPTVRRYSLLFKIIAFVLLAGVVAGAAVCTFGADSLVAATRGTTVAADV